MNNNQSSLNLVALSPGVGVVTDDQDLYDHYFSVGYLAYSSCCECPYDLLTQSFEWASWMDGFGAASVDSHEAIRGAA